MDIAQKLGLMVFLIFLLFSLLALSDIIKKTQTCPEGVLGLNYTLPMFLKCTEKGHLNDRTKLIPAFMGDNACQGKTIIQGNIPGYRVCKIPVSGRPRDCFEIQTGGVNISGVYPIYPDGDGDPFFVYCDMETDGGGWSVFQRKEDISVDFFLYWSDYKHGLGDLSSEHWLGNGKIHRLSTQKTYELRVDLEDVEGETRYASYNNFSVKDEAGQYALTVGDFSGDTSNIKGQSSNQSFNTSDRINDGAGWLNCPDAFTGAWWYRICQATNFNGLYLNGTTTKREKEMVWSSFQGNFYSLKKAEMKIRPV